MIEELRLTTQKAQLLLSNSDLSGSEAQAMAASLLQIGAKILGYNNFENSNISGEKFFINTILSRLKPSLCVDVGANVGSYSDELLAALDTNVIAFEPLLSPYAELELLKDKYPDRFTPENLAVGDKSGTSTINFNPAATEHASLIISHENISYINNSCNQEIKIVSLDEYFASRADSPDFIKIDVEGFESEVLSGAQRLLLNSPPKCLQIEINWHQLFRCHSLWSLSQYLPSYHVYQLLPNAICLKDPRDPLSNLFMFSNFIFIRADQTHLIPEPLGPLTD